MSANEQSSTTMDEALDAARRAQLLRRASSINLSMLGIGAAVIGGSILANQSRAGFIQVLTVPAVFLLLWGVVHARAEVVGVRKPGVGYRAIAVVALLSLLFGLLPLTATIGALTMLGIGFFVIGFRERSWPVSTVSILAMGTGLLTACEPVRRLVGINETSTSYVTAGIAALVLAVVALAGTAWSALAENQGLRVG